MMSDQGPTDNTSEDSYSVRKLAVIMFTDIAGYTALMGRDEENTLKLIQKNRALQKPLIEKYKGKWLKEMGDGVLAMFTGAHSAVKCGLEIQMAAGPELKNKIRIGIHLGEVTLENNDVFGDGVNIASRLEGMGNPGGVYFSEDVKAAIERSGEFEVFQIGDIRLKNVVLPVKMYCLQHEGMPAPISERIKRQLASDKIRSIAILPFANLSGNTEQQYFVDGMHDALITEISKIGSLRVISRTSTLRYRGSDKSIPQIASELDVDGLIEASVMMTDDKIRIQVQLIKAFPDEEHIWADSYDRNIENIFDVHGAVVKEVTDKIKVKLTPGERSHLNEPVTVHPDAYKTFLNGKHIMEKLSPEAFGKGKEYLEQSIAIDDSFAPAYAELANYYMYMLQMRLISVTEAFPKIFHNIRKALAIDPNHDQANLSMAFVSWFEWDWKASEKGFLKVLETNPNHVQANAFYAHLLMLTGRMPLAVTYGSKAVELDPLNDLVLSLYGVVLAHSGQFDKAVMIARESLKINPRNILTIRLLEFASYAKVDLETSVQMLTLIYSSVFPIQMDIEKEYAEKGYAPMIEKLALSLGKHSKGQDFYIAAFFNRAGKSEKAILWMERAYENHDSDVPYFFVTREFDNIKSDPRIRGMSEKVNLPT